MSEHYLDPARGAAIGAELAARDRQGKYDFDDPRRFAMLVTRDLREIDQDKHLGIHFDPEMSAALPPGGAGSVPEDKAAKAEKLALGRRYNHGVREMRLYPGNIRYIRISSFADWTGGETIKAYENAMRFLGGGDAIIVDLRGNPGGWPQPSDYMISHFLDPNTPLYAEYKQGKKVSTVRSAAKLSVPRLKGKPLYVLTNSHSASAAEFFPYYVRQYGLGEVIGTATAGAAHNFEGFPLPHGFAASVSVGTTIFPGTGGNWEGVGISPHVETPSELALDTALLRATEKLAAVAPPELRPHADGEVQKLRQALESRAASLPVGLGVGLAVGTTRVMTAVPGGTAAAMGLREGDFIVAINGKALEGDGAMQLLDLSGSKVGDPVTLAVKREGRRMDLSGKALPRPERRVPPSPW